MPSEPTTAEDVIAKHRANHAMHGTTHAIYWPPEAPWDLMERVMDEVVNLVYGVERKGWDAFCFGRGGDCVLIEADELAAHLQQQAASAAQAEVDTPAQGTTRPS